MYATCEGDRDRTIDTDITIYFSGLRKANEEADDLSGILGRCSSAESFIRCAGQQLGNWFLMQIKIDISTNSIDRHFSFKITC